MLYSLLLATLGRTDDVEHFLASAARQTIQDFEVLVIDQNDDGRLVPILARYTGALDIKHLRCERGHSRAFNFGMAHARGEFLAFPDDDCWYDPNLLQLVTNRFAAFPTKAGITGREVVEAAYVSGGRFDSCAGPVTRENVWRRAITFTIFLRRDVAREYRFDESLGVGAGTPWGAGEESDFLLQLIADGHGIHYDPDVTVWHRGRSGPYTRELNAKAGRYGRGMGRVLAKHHYGAGAIGEHLIRPLGGAVLSLARGRFDKAAYHWSIFCGRAAGWLDPLSVVTSETTAQRREPLAHRGART